MRCIIAIWPAGPPKLRQPILSQTLKNSPKVGAARRPTACVFDCHDHSRHLGRPVVTLLRGKAQIGEQRIVDHEAAVAAGHDRRRRRAPTARATPRAGRRPPARDRAARCRRRARSARAGASDGSSSSPNSLSMVSKLQRGPSCEISTPSMSNGMAPVSLATSDDLGRDRRYRMRACGSRKRRISHGQATRSIFGRRRVTQRLGRCGAKRSSAALLDQRQLGFGPGGIAAGQHARVDSLAAQMRRRNLAHVMGEAAGEHDRTVAVERGRPSLDVGDVAPHRARQQARRRVVDRALARIDDLRRLRGADQGPEIVR